MRVVTRYTSGLVVDLLSDLNALMPLSSPLFIHTSFMVEIEEPWVYWSVDGVRHKGSKPPMLWRNPKANTKRNGKIG